MWGMRGSLQHCGGHEKLKVEEGGWEGLPLPDEGVEGGQWLSSPPGERSRH